MEVSKQLVNLNKIILEEKIIDNLKLHTKNATKSRWNECISKFQNLLKKCPWTFYGNKNGLNKLEKSLVQLINSDTKIKHNTNNELTPIRLNYVKSRKFLNATPTHLLKNNNKTYHSDFCDGFNLNESDWIIFRTCKNSVSINVLPEFIKIKNADADFAIKSISILIGNDNDNLWFNLGNLNVKKIKELMLYPLNYDKNEFLKFKKQHKTNHLKIELQENWGYNNEIGCKFIFYFFGVFGNKI